jgi:uncharacterized membrane protein YhhN
MSTASTWLVMAVLVVVMLLLERRPATPRAVYGVAKMLAAATFVAYGVARVGDGTGSAALIAALVLSLVGDALLIPRGSKGFFLAGLGAFLAAHLAFVPAFAARGVSASAFAASTLVVALAAAGVLRWLRPHVHGTMWRAVVAYVVVICAMLCTSIAAVARAVTTNDVAPAPLLVLGTFLFWLSDLTIARQRFVAPGYANRAVGIPLYFFAQLVIVDGWRGAAGG